MFRTKSLMTGFLLLASTGVCYASGVAEPVIGQPYAQVADAHDVVHDAASGTIARSSSGACIRTQWSNGYDMCGPEAPVKQVVHTEVHKAAALSREQRTVYFAFNQAGLSPEMKQRLDGLASTLTTDSQVKGAHIVGYADKIGNANYNEKLSKKRADNVRQYLVARGLINTSVADTRWFGASNPATDCSSKLKRPELIACLQPDRRVEVEIDFTPDVHADAQ
jgi:outer membrane protein OmpA-like peptidoglycan-associated protein